jgi:hypothetical protein
MNRWPAQKHAALNLQNWPGELPREFQIFCTQRRSCGEWLSQEKLSKAQNGLRQKIRRMENTAAEIE